MKLHDYWPLVVFLLILAYMGWYKSTHTIYNLPTLTEKVQQLEQRVNELEDVE